MKELKNKKIYKVEISIGEHFLIFETDIGKMVYEAIGDCCSESWFAEIIGLNNIIGEKVIEVIEKDLPSYNLDDGRSRQEIDSVYCYTLTTKKGHCDIVFRNSSNGYYGGYLEFSEFGNIPDEYKPLVDISKLSDWASVGVSN